MAARSSAVRNRFELLITSLTILLVLSSNLLDPQRWFTPYPGADIHHRQADQPG
jgi:hypothetical protein